MALKKKDSSSISLEILTEILENITLGYHTE